MGTGAADSWYHEKESAWLYGAVAAAEPDPGKRALFVKLAAAAEDQASLWLASRPDLKPVFIPALRARIVARLVRRMGPRRLRSVLAAMKLRGLSVYSGSKPLAPHAMPTTVAEVGERHASVGGGNLRAGVFGASDGLVSNAALVMGVAAAGADLHTIQITGVAGLLAGALSMSAGEYVSVRSQREFYEYQMALEREELAEYPEAEAEELALIYNARGIDLEEARRMSTALLSRPQEALDVLAREELGLNPDDLGSPFAAAGSSFLAFAVGATIPLIPFFAGASGLTAAYSSAAVTALALFAVGIALSLFTGRGAFRGGFRMVLIGGGAGVAAWGVGKLLGASLAEEIPMRVIAIVGHQGSGKTTLIEKLIPALIARDLTVSTIKHTHHHQIEFDVPGKDSHRHRVAGASEVIVASDSGWARLAASQEPASLQILLGQLRPVDVVLVEGFKKLEWLRRVEVFRGQGTPLALTDPGIAAVAVSAGVALPGFGGLKLPLDDTPAVVDFILSA